jgi:outer membrane protein assembly factor BamB
MTLVFASLLILAQIRFAWLSDLHIGGSTGLDDVRAAVQDMNNLNDIRFVLVTGDITESGATADLLLARAALDALTVPYYILPGNHDTKWSESGATAFPSIFGRERFAERIGDFLLVGFHQGPRMRMADGHFAPEDLRWLDTTLAEARSAGRPVLVATHYPLDSGISNWYEALERLRTVDTRMVFVGHGHRSRPQEYEGIRAAMGRSVLRGRDARGGYNLVTISGDSILIAERTTAVETGVPWYTSSFGALRLGKDTAWSRPDYSVNAEYPDVRIRWQYSAGSTILAGGALAEDRFIVGDYSGTLHALHVSDGSPVWTVRTGGRFTASPAAAAGRVVATSTDSSLHCYDLRSGREIWQVRSGSPIVAAPALANGLVYSGAGDGLFRAIDLSSGTVVWETGGLQAFVEARPAVTDEMVVVGAWDETLYAFERATGAIRWRWQGETRGRLLSPAACWPVVSHGRVFIVAPDRKMTALDAGTGAVVWRTDRHQVRESIGSGRDGSRVYVRTMRDSLVAVSAESDAGEDLWTLHAGFGYDINAAMPVEHEGVLFFGTMRGVLVAVDAGSGTLLWKHRIGPSPINTVTPITARQVLCTDFDGKVTFVEAGR